MIQLPRFHVEPMLESGELVEVFAEWPEPTMPLHTVYPQRRQLSPLCGDIAGMDDVGLCGVLDEEADDIYEVIGRNASA